MPRYYFDVREEGRLLPNDVGLVFPDIEAARDQATRTLTEIARTHYLARYTARSPSM